LLRPRLLGYFDKETAEIRESFGDFILINTNFSNVNAFVPSLNLFLPGNKAGDTPKLGRAAVGMSREYAEGLRDYKLAVFEDIKGLIPNLEQAFPDHTIVVRPHPTEDPRVYHEIAGKCTRVRVTNKGNVIPWLRAAGALVHNSCTTGVEAYMMGVPAVTYMATRNEYYDDGYYRLPNSVSYRCFNFEELRLTLARIFGGEIGASNGDEHKELINYYLAAQQDRLACDRIVDVIEKIMAGRSELPKAAVYSKMAGAYRSNWRRLVKWYKSHLPDSKYRPEFQRHRYPGLTLKELSGRISKIQQVLGDTTEIKAEQISGYIVRVSAT